MPKNAANKGKREGHDLGRAAKSLRIGLRFSAWGSPSTVKDALSAASWPSSLPRCGWQFTLAAGKTGTNTIKLKIRPRDDILQKALHTDSKMAKVFTIPVPPDLSRKQRERTSDPRYVDGQKLLVEAMRYLAKADPVANRGAIELLSEHVRTRFRMTDSPLTESPLT